MKRKKIEFDYGTFTLGLAVFICPYFVISYLQGHDPAPLILQFVLAFLAYMILYVWVCNGGFERLNKSRELSERLHRVHYHGEIMRKWKRINNSVHSIEMKRQPYPPPTFQTRGLSESSFNEIEELVDNAKTTFEACGINYVEFSLLKELTRSQSADADHGTNSAAYPG